MHSHADAARIAKWVRYFALTWRASKYCDSGVFDHEEIYSWLSVCSRIPDKFDAEEMERTDRAMRRLRRTAVREYEVMYRVVVLGNTVAQVTDWLNERAEMNHIPLPEDSSKHYRDKDSLAILLTATEWLLAHW